jgi:hypothetical protein
MAPSDTLPNVRAIVRATQTTPKAKYPRRQQFARFAKMLENV